MATKKAEKTVKKVPAKKTAVTSKKTDHKVVIKPKQVKVHQEKQPEKVDERTILSELLKQAPRDVRDTIPETSTSLKAPVVEKQETGIQDVYQTHVDEDAGIGTSRAPRSIPQVNKPTNSGKLEFSSIMKKNNQVDEKSPRPFSFPKIR